MVMVKLNPNKHGAGKRRVPARTVCQPKVDFLKGTYKLHNKCLA